MDGQTTIIPCFDQRQIMGFHFYALPQDYSASFYFVTLHFIGLCFVFRFEHTLSMRARTPRTNSHPPCDLLAWGPRQGECGARSILISLIKYALPIAVFLNIMFIYEGASGSTYVSHTDQWNSRQYGGRHCVDSPSTSSIYQWQTNIISSASSRMWIDLICLNRCIIF